MRLIGLAVVFFGIACAGVAAQDQPLAQKACILRAASMLPTIPGLSISGSSTSKQDLAPVLRQQVSGIVSEQDVLRFLESFGSADVVTYEMARSAMATGEYQRGRDVLVAFAAKGTATALRVDISVNAAGVSATYSFACAVLKDGGVNVYPQGISK